MESETLIELPAANEMLNPILHATFNNGLPLQLHVDELLKHQKNPIIIVTSTPRSGTSWLVSTLIHLTKLPFLWLSSAYSTNEQDLYLPALCAKSRGCVALMHMKGTWHNNELMKMFNITPIILVRNIYDAIINLANNYKEKQKTIHSRRGDIGFSFLWSDVNIEKLDNYEFLNWIIDFAVPWYINFYVSWYRLNPNALWVRCEEITDTSDRFNTIRKILTFLKITPKVPLSSEIISKDYYTADGEPIFTKMSISHRIRVAKYFEYYSDVDFSKYGMVEK